MSLRLTSHHHLASHVTSCRSLPAGGQSPSVLQGQGSIQMLGLATPSSQVISKLGTKSAGDLSTENVARDNPFLNLIGPLVDLANLRVAIDRLQGPVLIRACDMAGKAVGATALNRVSRDFHCHFAPFHF